jgi:hypothetical protein
VSLLLSLLSTLLVALAAAALALAQDASRALEYQKAIFLYNFAKFVEWPPEKFDRGGPILVGIYGKDPFVVVLAQTLGDKTVGGRQLAVRHLTDVADIKTCHILFVSSGERKDLEPVLEAATAAGVLTVGETPKFAERGGMVGFAMRNNAVELNINVDAAARGHITISSKILKLAKLVRPESADGN